MIYPNYTDNEDQDYLWRIWDVLQLWRRDDHQWSSDEIQFVAEVMTDWVEHATGIEDTQTVMPPLGARRHDAYSYDLQEQEGDLE